MASSRDCVNILVVRRKDENTGGIAIAMLRIFLAFPTRPAECVANRSRSLLSDSLLDIQGDIR